MRGGHARRRRRNAGKAEAAKVSALKAQLKFRQSVLQQDPVEHGVFQFTYKGHKRTSDELKVNLLKLVDSAGTSAVAAQPPDEGNFLVGKKVVHNFVESDGEHSSYRGLVVSRVPSFPDWYNIVYETEPSTVYTYELLQDYKNGDLVVA